MILNNIYSGKFSYITFDIDVRIYSYKRETFT